MFLAVRPREIEFSYSRKVPGERMLVYGCPLAAVLGNIVTRVFQPVTGYISKSVRASVPRISIF